MHSPEVIAGNNVTKQSPGSMHLKTGLLRLACHDGMLLMILQE
jgi:hypothetical protein